MEFRILGPLEVWHGDRRLPLGGPKPRALLAILLLGANSVMTVDELIDGLWGQRPPETARATLQSYILRLRKVFNVADERLPQHLVTRPSGYALHLDPGQLDLHCFDRLVAQAKQAMADNELHQVAIILRQALALWRGSALADVASDSLRQIEGPRLEERRMMALEDRIEADLRLSRHAELVGELEALVAAHPVRERLRSQLMLALYRSGRQVEALSVYRDTRRVLTEELGLEPSPMLRRLEQAILVADASLDLGEATAALTEPAKPRLAPRQLPGDIDDLTGRDRVLEDIGQVFKRSPTTAVPVASISGAAGIGKTALAVRLAHRLREDFPDGQLYADLGGTADRPLDPGEVLAEFLVALGVQGDTIPQHLEGRVRLYRSRLASQAVLVVLDDVADQAQARPLLPGSPTCGVVTTSRSPLAAPPAAHRFTLGPLEPRSAVELLANIIGWDRVLAEPDAAESLALLCDGQPLALRIAGSKLAAKPHWRLVKLVERLGDDRGRLDELRVGDLEVRAGLASSYAALDEDARRAFRLLALLKCARFTSGIAASLLGRSPTDAENVIERLVDAQLVQTAVGQASGQVTYHLTGMVSLFAHERLDQEEPAPQRDAALRRLLDDCLTLAERAGALLGR